MDYSEFTNFLRDRMRERNFSIKRLSEMTGISIKHLEAIINGDAAQFPSRPYLRGYLYKLGAILDFNPDEAWAHMKKFADDKSSGKSDELPKNRFSEKPVNKYLLIGGVVLLILFYVTFRYYKILGAPTITINNPAENMVVENANYISVSGNVADGDELKLNGETVEIKPGGDWEKNVLLQPGINTLEITAKKFLGRETKVIRQVVYSPVASNESPTSTSGQNSAR